MVATIEAMPIDALPDPPSKRGRALSDHPEAVKARKRRDDIKAGRIVPGSKPKRATRRRTAARRGPKSLRPEIGAALTMLNTVLIMSPLGTRPAEAIIDPNVIPERIGDELDEAEINALASAIDAQCQRSPRFKRYVERFLTAGASGQLVTVVGIIAVRRMSRHGMAPEPLDPMLGMALAGGGIDALGDMMSPPAPDLTPDADTGEVAPIRTDAMPDAGFDFERDG